MFDPPPADVAYAGLPGAFAEEAAARLVGEEASKLPCEGFRAVLDAVVSGRAHCGVLPLENRIAGPVGEVQRLLASGAFRVVRTIDQPIVLTLVGKPGANMDEVREVLSHPMALAQCSKFFRANPRLRPIPAYNTAAAVERILADAAGQRAAIASERAARIHGGVVLRSNLEDRQPNATRFALVVFPHASDGGASARRGRRAS